MKPETIEVPFITIIGNRQVLTRQSVEEDPRLADFVKRFSHCFKPHPFLDVLIYEPPVDEPPL